MRFDWLIEARWVTKERLTAYPRIFLAVFTAAALAWIALGEGPIDPGGKPFGTDFLSFWASSSLALDGSPAAAYDFDEHAAAEAAAIGRDGLPYYSWHYPPIYLLLILPLALLPYLWSLAAWLAATFAAYFMVARRIAGERETMWLLVAFPAVFVNLGHGQNGFLTAALLGGALLMLDRRPWLAGILIGLLTFKPQLGVLLPLVLMASGRWRTFAAASLTALALVGASIGAFGMETWLAFLDNVPMASAVMEDGIVGWHKMLSAFAAVRLVGGGVGAAYAIHGLVAAAAVAAVLWIWRRPADLPVKGSALVCATLLVTPFALDYDLMLLALPIGWLVTEGRRHGFMPWEGAVLAMAWLLPLISRTITEATMVPLSPIMIGALLGLIVRRVAVNYRAPALAGGAMGTSAGRLGGALPA